MHVARKNVIVACVRPVHAWLTCGELQTGGSKPTQRFQGPRHGASSVGLKKGQLYGMSCKVFCNAYEIEVMLKAVKRVTTLEF